MKAGQYEDYITASHDAGFTLPATEGLHALKDVSKTIKEANRQSPSFWNELMNFPKSLRSFEIERPSFKAFLGS